MMRSIQQRTAGATLMMCALLTVVGMLGRAEAASPNAKKNRSSSSTSLSSSSSSSSSNISSSSSSNMSSSSSSVQSSASGRVWGAFVGNQLTDAATFENLVGRKMTMQSIFVGGYDAFPSAYGPSVRDQGKTLVIFWEPTGLSLDQIIGGALDLNIKNFASGARTYAGPIIFVPFAEMNGNWSSWGGTVGSNTPTKFITAWRHVHDLFAGISNVTFAWDVNSGSVPDTAGNAIAQYYPGDAYTDYVGVDGFNFGNPWLTFDQIFSAPLAILSNYHKPIMIFSMACAPGSLKAAWITDSLSTQMARHPEIRGWIWFNANKEKDWRVNSDPLSLSAFKAALP